MADDENQIKYFDDETKYRIDQVVNITGFSDTHVRRELKKQRVHAEKIGSATRNNIRVLGKDLNNVFPVEIIELSPGK